MINDNGRQPAEQYTTDENMQNAETIMPPREQIARRTTRRRRKKSNMKIYLFVAIIAIIIAFAAILFFISKNSNNIPEFNLVAASTSIPVFSPTPTATQNPNLREFNDENFSIRNGIRFGMSVEEVIEVEKANGEDLKDSHHGYWNLITHNLAGVPGSGYIHYYFDSEQGLNVCLYQFTRWIDSDSSGFADSIITTLCEAYTKKYGPPVSTGSEMIDTMGSAQTALDIYKDDITGYNSSLKYSINHFSQWLFPLQDGSMIEIMLINVDDSYKSSLSGTVFKKEHIYITYTYRTRDEVQAFNEKLNLLDDARNADI